jgi:hypothetical protein
MARGGLPRETGLPIASGFGCDNWNFDNDQHFRSANGGRQMYRDTDWHIFLSRPRHRHFTTCPQTDAELPSYTFY